MILGCDRIVKDFMELEPLGKAWLLFATLSTFFIAVYLGDNWLGITSAVTNILCVILVANGKISNYFWGLIGIVAYAYIAFTNKYYGDFMLNTLYFFPMAFIGWYYWSKNNTQDTVESKFLTNKQRGIVGVICIVAILIYGFCLKWLGGNLPFVDATSTILSIMATYLLTKQYMEQWFFWIGVNIVTIYMWASVFISSGNEIATLMQWIIFLINSTYGLYSWIKRHNQGLQNN